MELSFELFLFLALFEILGVYRTLVKFLPTVIKVGYIMILISLDVVSIILCIIRMAFIVALTLTAAALLCIKWIIIKSCKLTIAVIKWPFQAINRSLLILYEGRLCKMMVLTLLISTIILELHLGGNIETGLSKFLWTMLFISFLSAALDWTLEWLKQCLNAFIDFASNYTICEVFWNDEDSEDCPICLETMNAHTCNVRAFVCRHWLHNECYKQLQAGTYLWRCPVCRCDRLDFSRPTSMPIPTTRDVCNWFLR